MREHWRSPGVNAGTESYQECTSRRLLNSLNRRPRKWRVSWFTMRSRLQSTLHFGSVSTDSGADSVMESISLRIVARDKCKNIRRWVVGYFHFRVDLNTETIKHNSAKYQ
jgi:hypothetical protein